MFAITKLDSTVETGYRRMRLLLAAARKYVLIICMRLLAVISMHLLTVL